MQFQPVYIFDLDNTLIDTQAKIKVGDQYYSSQEYNNLDIYTILSLHHQGKLDIDFSAFDSLDQLLSEPLIEPTFQKLVDAYNKGSIIYILTSRFDEKLIWDWLKFHNIEIPITRILTRSDSSTGGKYKKMDAVTFKKQQIYGLLEKFGTSVEINYYEDDIKVVNAIINEQDGYLYNQYHKNFKIHLC